MLCCFSSLALTSLIYLEPLFQICSISLRCSLFLYFDFFYLFIFCHYALQFLYTHCVISILPDKQISVCITISYLMFLRAIYITFWWLRCFLLSVNFKYPFFVFLTNFCFQFFFPLYVFCLFSFVFLFIFQFIKFCYCYFIFTFWDSLCLVDFVLFTYILRFFWVFLHSFLFCCFFTFEVKPFLTVSTLYLCLKVFVTLYTVFIFLMSCCSFSP